MIGASANLDVGMYTYMPAAVGPELKPVTCCSDDERACETPAQATIAARVEKKRMLAVKRV